MRRSVKPTAFAVSAKTTAATFLTFLLSTQAFAQGDQACAAAIDHGKWLITDCIENGESGCRTAETLDMAWELALEAERPLELGGCYSGINSLCDIFWDGTPSEYGACGASVGMTPW